MIESVERKFTIGEYIITRTSDVETGDDCSCVSDNAYISNYRQIGIRLSRNSYCQLEFHINTDNELFNLDLTTPKYLIDMLNNKEVMQEIYNTESLKKDFEIIVDTFSKFNV